LIEVNLVQFENATSLIVVTLFGRTIDVKFIKSLNTLTSITNTFDGIVIDVTSRAQINV
jgi:hypothetical protein